jgi:hypothetical protein
MPAPKKKTRAGAPGPLVSLQAQPGNAVLPKEPRPPQQPARDSFPATTATLNHMPDTEWGGDGACSPLHLYWNPLWPSHFRVAGPAGLPKG